MLLQLVLDSELLLTHMALEWLLTCVDFFMISLSICRLEAFATKFAQVRLDISVNLFMVLQLELE